ncbi:unnamed protein product [Zymoseptoria tritici ST99CH_1A5]|uniref:AB hydrolase-1 domain-containing protein n=1 Tax=Zymoseptoria tritici ST99CH_1A5 TaxID=1276529 RepID=A0A1Y6LH89_ZYMTR|nr:unnamed protein product [Zymoseptoria tritici ST99CH_1A5]
MPITSPVWKQLLYGATIAVGLYAVFIGLQLSPTVQRLALYSHKFNTLFWDDIHDGEAFGFAKHQVTPFNIVTPDGVTLFGWHILPVNLYARHEAQIRTEERPAGQPVEDFTKTTAYELLTAENLDTKVVVSFHGNAGHIAQGWRKDANRYLSTASDTHVFTIDYRGFGHSTGTPTEAGVILDGVTLLDWIMNVAKVDPERIVIMGQSLGTAVTSAVALHYADPKNTLVPSEPAEVARVLASNSDRKPVTFAGIILAASFVSVPGLMRTYKVAGLISLVAPLKPFPFILDQLLVQLADTWQTGERLAAYYDALKGSPKLHSGSRSMGSLQLLHAINDADIPYHQTEIICRRILGSGDTASQLKLEGKDGQTLDGSKGPAVLDVNRKDRPRLRFEIVRNGAHNQIIAYSSVAVAVSRAFQDSFADNHAPQRNKR